MTYVLTLPENTKGRDFVVGDIHGAFDMLEKALVEAHFDPAKDRLISVGDLVDRGPESPRCLEFLKQPWFLAIGGNHEALFLHICREDGTFDAKKAEWNRRNGMGWVFDLKPETITELWKVFSKLPIAIEVPTSRGTVGFVHADVPEGMDWKTFKDKIAAGDRPTIEIALWGRTRITEGDDSGVDGVGRIFFGHTVVGSGPRQLGNCYFIDTGGVHRLLQGDTLAHKFFLTVADITARTKAFQGPPIDPVSRQKIVTDVPEKKKPFRKNGSSPNK